MPIFIRNAQFVSLKVLKYKIVRANIAIIYLTKGILQYFAYLGCPIYATYGDIPNTMERYDDSIVKHTTSNSEVRGPNLGHTGLRVSMR